ncbi:MAG TPA: immune inhibitor A domain-containing protein [Propionibacteriaceae bacterium]|nr:immune inhibitor A domain-containing protein [Propionibacteriaceae bacterium]
MRRALIGLLGLVLSAGLAAGSSGLAAAGPSDTTPTGVTGRGDDGPLAKSANGDKVVDELPNPAEEKRRELRERALNLVLTGRAKAVRRNGSTVVKIGTKKASYTKKQVAQLRAGLKVKAKTVDQYVELSREKSDKIFVVLTEFGNTRATDIDPKYGDIDTNSGTPGPATFDGPLHNRIPAPDRRVDNSTVWQKNYSPAHYRKLYFGTGKGVESLKTYYERQSSGRYTVNGLVTDWVKVKYNEARYGRSGGFPCDSNVCSNVWHLMRDGVNQWTADQQAKGRTPAQIKAALKSFDKWDRYDFDGDGNFNEADGYLDHFQVVHAGGDEADGDPQQGEDAIWSHRSYAFLDDIGRTGPAKNPFGGTQVGTTGLWVGDYTIQPENGGLSVFAHEYGHDLGLPDHYDTAGGGDNAVNWWSLMAQSRARAKRDVGIGTRPADLGIWDKMQLGWLDYEVAIAGQRKTFNLGPHEYNTKTKPQGLVVVLPDKKVTKELPRPTSGTKQWYSGTGHGLNNTLTRQVTLPAGSATLSFRANYDIEDCGLEPCDYAYVEANDGGGWQAIPGTIAKSAEGNGIDGTSKAWVPASFDLSAYAGRTIGLRLRYRTDAAAAGNSKELADGLFLDDLALTANGTTVFTDDAETGDGGWTAAGFTVVGATITTEHDHYYLASNRSYVSYDRYLKTGPYNFGFGSTLPDKVEFFPYQQGLLVNYWDTSYSDNNQSQHPGSGLVLPIDAHPDVLYNLQGQAWRGRIQTYDAPFSRLRADSFTLHVNGQPSYIKGRASQPLFDDTRSYWRAELPNVGVKTPGVGVTLRVVKQKGTSMTVELGRSTPVTAVNARK